MKFAVFSISVATADGVIIGIVSHAHVQLTHVCKRVHSGTFQSEGWRALFKGGFCRMLVMAPLFGIAQMVYYFGVGEFILRMPRQ